MLPLSLKVHNFLSYRDDAPTLHLEDIHVACLCGANGHGKSALLDAITWAIWGRARGQRQEQLVHEGEQDMRVELEFDEGGQRHRIARRFSKARRAGASSLELAVASGDEWVPLTANTMAQTAAQIERLIRMDYDTFVNSAYLLQGRSDTFAMSTPANRKEVLARVLGLAMYDRLSDRARQRARDAQAKVGMTTAQIERLEMQAARRGDVETLLAEVSAEAERAIADANARSAEFDLAGAEVAQLERRQADGEAVGAQLRRVSERCEREEHEQAQLSERVQRWRASLEQATPIERGFAEWQEARDQHARLSAKASLVHRLQSQLAPLETRIAAEGARLEAEAAGLERELDDVGPRAQSLADVRQRLAQLDVQAQALDEGLAQVETHARRHRALVAEVEVLKADNARLENEGKETRSKLDLLNHDHSKGVECPLCGSELGEEGRERLERAYNSEIAGQRERYKAQARKVSSLESDARQESALMAQVQRAVETKRRALDSERAELLLQEEQATTAAARLEGVRAALAELRARIEQGAFAQTEQAQVAELRVQIEAAAFDSDALDDLRQEVQALEHWEGEQRGLEEARRRLNDDQSTLASAAKRVVDTQEELARLATQQRDIEAELAGLPEARRRRDELERLQREAAARRDELQGRRGSLGTQLEQIEAAETELVERRMERESLADDAGLYDELGVAFGKGGVQALLIEAAIPRLEDEANALLSRMTDGRMSLKMQTQRVRRTGGTNSDLVETLHIDVADELGTRSYDLFSGGERFRVDLALRIALSKLLAWRAGAQLPTLFIDEGFGTQDAQGRDRIVEVIKAIEDDFQRILVITHMDEVKEAFPVRIEVSRAVGGGSTFSVS